MRSAPSAHSIRVSELREGLKTPRELGQRRPCGSNSDPGRVLIGHIDDNFLDGATSDLHSSSFTKESNVLFLLGNEDGSIRIRLSTMAPTVLRFASDSARWDAVRTRDPAAEGVFVYCVKTTKIYCRPTCKARLARRSNVEFFDTGPEAEAAGYRACKRCRPQLATYIPDADLGIGRVRNMLENLPDDAPLPKLEALAADAGLTKYHFHRCFKKATGLTPREYALARRHSRMSEADLRSTAAAPSNMSTPTLVVDVGMASDMTATPDALQTPDFDLGDWDMDGFDVPVLFDDYALPFGSEDGNVNAIVSEPILSHQALKDADFMLSTITIHYSMVETTHGALLMAFQESQLCKMELAPTALEVMASLQVSFPGHSYTLAPIETLEQPQLQSVQQQVTAVVDALEQPTGKTLNL